MLQQIKHYRIQVTMSLDEFIQYGDAVKAHLEKMPSYSLCGDMIRIPRRWVNKVNFDLFHPTFEDYTEFIGESDRFIYYALPCIKDSIQYYIRSCALAYEDINFYTVVFNYIYR